MFDRNSQSEEDKKKSRNFGLVIAYLIFGGVSIWQLVFGIRVFVGAANPKPFRTDEITWLVPNSYVEGRAATSSHEACTYKHSVNFIPTAKEHYYLVFSDDFSTAYCIRGGKNWKKQFQNIYAVDPAGAKLEGYVVRTQHDVKKLISQYLQNLNADGMQVSCDVSVYIDMLAKPYAILHILEGGYMLAILIWVLMNIIRKTTLEETVKGRSTVWAVLFAGSLVVYALAMIHTLSMY